MPCPPVFKWMFSKHADIHVSTKPEKSSCVVNIIHIFWDEEPEGHRDEVHCPKAPSHYVKKLTSRAKFSDSKSVVSLQYHTPSADIRDWAPGNLRDWGPNLVYLATKYRLHGSDSSVTAELERAQSEHTLSEWGGWASPMGEGDQAVNFRTGQDPIRCPSPTRPLLSPLYTCRWPHSTTPTALYCPDRALTAHSPGHSSPSWPLPWMD